MYDCKAAFLTTVLKVLLAWGFHKAAQAFGKHNSPVSGLSPEQTLQAQLEAALSTTACQNQHLS